MNYSEKDKNELRQKLTFIVKKLRKNNFLKNVKFNKPQSVKHDEVFFRDKVRMRKRIVLSTSGCSIASCTMCPLPNEALGRDKKVTPNDLIEQIKRAFKNKDNYNYEIVTVYSNNNFFSDQDMFPEVRRFLYQQFKKSSASYLVVESLPQFITQAKVLEAKKILRKRKKTLVVAIGLQSSNDIVRELAINSTCTRSAFENAVKLLKDNNFMVQVFLMIKPPFLLEKEAIKDSVASIKYLTSLGIYEPILCATRVSPNTLVNFLYKEKKFHPPWLWTIIEILKKSYKQVPNSRPRVAVSELYSKNNLSSSHAHNCDKCNDDVVALIERFNHNRNIHIFDKLNCGCYREYKKYLSSEMIEWKKRSIQERVSEFIKKY